MMKDIIIMIDELLDDRSVPKNVRARMEEIKGNLKDSNKEPGVKIGTSISIMDEVSNDPNLPIYARTMIWNIVSKMETELKSSRRVN
jgi:uncharacterized protein